jgi:hypothetical protein
MVLCYPKACATYGFKYPPILEDSGQSLTVVARGFVRRLYRELVEHDKQINEIETELSGLLEHIIVS